MSASAPTNYLPILVRSGVVTEWERGFCASLIRRQRNGFPLTDRQAATLQRIVDRFQQETMGDDGVVE